MSAKLIKQLENKRKQLEDYLQQIRADKYNSKLKKSGK